MKCKPIPALLLGALTLVIPSAHSLAQSAAPALEWSKCFGGTESDYLRSIVQTTDGGFIAAGYTSSIDGDLLGLRIDKNNDDFWIVKISNTGVIEWEKVYGGSHSEQALSIIQTTDSGYVIAGYTQSNDGDVTGFHGTFPNSDGWVIKIDRNGVLQWERALGGSGQDELHSIVQTNDGGYIVTGSSSSFDGDLAGRTPTGAIGLWCIKLASDGTPQWHKIFGGSKGENGASVIVTDDGGFAITGTAQSVGAGIPPLHGSCDFWVFKFDGNGNLQWDSTYGGNKYQEPFSLIQTSDQGFVIVGRNGGGGIPRYHAAFDFCVMKLDSTGALDWKNDYGSSGTDQAMSIKQICNGNFIVTGCVDSSNGDVKGLHGTGGQDDGWAVMLDPCGSIIWEKCLGGIFGEEALCVIQSSDGGFVIAGDAASNDGDVMGLYGIAGRAADGWIVKLSPPVIPDIHLYIKSATLSAQAGDTIEIPLYINSSDPANAAHGLESATLNYQFRTDLITPFAFIPAIAGMSTGKINMSSASASLNLTFPCFTFTGETEIGKLRCIAYVTDTLESDIVLSGDTVHQCFNTLSDGSEHLIITGCGAQTLSNFMKFGTAFNILSITPNPAGNSVLVMLKNNGSLLHYELLDALGGAQKSGTTTSTQLQINLSGLSSGNYYFRLSGEGGIPITKTLVIVK